ncbi:hypothetical protein GOBAR_AA06546 [Gossypium barbadense]|uniref:Uncharacterized protein n=1 Tax=Gossypium barbadense TaxID=3634 RepID=A0A2P5YEL9_GOSBA|nr:hypothetical protein GOBAR_AA06546 [Gossypium barbadense]
MEESRREQLPKLKSEDEGEMGVSHIQGPGVGIRAGNVLMWQMRRANTVDNVCRRRESEDWLGERGLSSKSKRGREGVRDAGVRQKEGKGRRGRNRWQRLGRIMRRLADLNSQSSATGATRHDSALTHSIPAYIRRAAGAVGGTQRG